MEILSVFILVVKLTGLYCWTWKQCFGVFSWWTNTTVGVNDGVHLCSCGNQMTACSALLRVTALACFLLPVWANSHLATQSPHSTLNSEHHQNSKSNMKAHVWFRECTTNNSLPAKFLSFKELLGTFLLIHFTYPSLYTNSSEDTAGNGSEISSVTDELWWEQILFIYLFILQMNPTEGCFNSNLFIISNSQVIVWVSSSDCLKEQTDSLCPSVSQVPRLLG